MTDTAGVQRDHYGHFDQHGNDDFYRVKTGACLVRSKSKSAWCIMCKRQVLESHEKYMLDVDREIQNNDRQPGSDPVWQINNVESTLLNNPQCF